MGPSWNPALNDTRDHVLPSASATSSVGCQLLRSLAAYSMMGGRNEEAGSYQLRPSLPVNVTTARCESAQNPASFEQRSAMRLGL